MISSTTEKLVRMHCRAIDSMNIGLNPPVLDTSAFAAAITLALCITSQMAQSWVDKSSKRGVYGG